MKKSIDCFHSINFHLSKYLIPSWCHLLFSNSITVGYICQSFPQRHHWGDVRKHTFNCHISSLTTSKRGKVDGFEEWEYEWTPWNLVVDPEMFSSAILHWSAVGHVSRSYCYMYWMRYKALSGDWVPYSSPLWACIYQASWSKSADLIPWITLPLVIPRATYLERDAILAKPQSFPIDYFSIEY